MDIQTTADTQATDFPVPLSIDEFRASILEAYRMYAFLVLTVTNSTDKAVGMFDLPADQVEALSVHLFDPGFTTQDLGIPYAAVQKTAFAQTLEELYDFAYRGIARRQPENFSQGGDFTWISTAVLALATSMFVYEWSGHGIANNAELLQCLKVIDTANARCALEFGTCFFYRNQAESNGNPVESLMDDGLTISQMALLSGMAEITIRAAANPKRSNRLKTNSTSNGTRIDRNDAKEWLISKGRYVPIRFEVASPLDLVQVKYGSPEALADAVKMQIEAKIACGSNDLLVAVNQMGNHYGFANNSLRSLISSVLRDDKPLRELAALLEVSADLLVLRAREVCLLKELSVIQTEIKQVAGSNK